VLGATLIPRIAFRQESFVALIAVLGTTISPYLFFWQASQEAEELENHRGEKALKHAPLQANVQLQRIHIDTIVGMAFSNAVAFFIILTAASTLHTHGITNVSTCGASLRGGLKTDFFFGKNMIVKLDFGSVRTTTWNEYATPLFSGAPSQFWRTDR
jgi:hypothetical protein